MVKPVTKIHILSDLHVEKYRQQSENYTILERSKVDADLVILAGDIHKAHHGLSWSRNMFPEQEIIYICGNHELYGREYYSLIKLMRERAELNKIHFLERDEIVINDIRFLGCTLWTDYKCYDFWSHSQALLAMNYALADHRLIKIKDGEKERLFTTEDALAINIESKEWLTKKLVEEEFSGPTVVISHHGPSLACKHKYFGHNEMSAAFYSDFDHLVEQADFWVYGHTHSNLNTKIGKCRLLSNQKGYPNEQTYGFDENLIIEI